MKGSDPMNRTKHIVKFLIFAAAAAIPLLLGAGKDLNIGQGLSLSWAGVGRIFLVIFAVMAAEHLILLILGLLKSENHRLRTFLITSKRLAQAGYFSLSDRYETLHLCD